AQTHLALGEAEDQHRRLARDARRLAVEVLVGDEVAHHDKRLACEAVDERAQARVEAAHGNTSRALRLLMTTPTPRHPTDRRQRSRAPRAARRDDIPTRHGRTR